MNKKIILLSCIMFIIVIGIFLLNYVNKYNENELSSINGIFIADGTQHKFIIGYENGQFIYANNTKPLYLNLYKNGNYKIEMENFIETGTYSLNNDKLFLKNKDGLITENCVLKNNNELHCDKYASLYIKQ